jgi:K(+)-stimulated pyrophosphate-energized sodium pump
VKLGQNESIMGALYKGFMVAGGFRSRRSRSVNFLMFGGFGQSFTTAAGVTFTSGALFGLRRDRPRRHGAHSW